MTWILDKRLKVLSNILWTKKSGTHWSMETLIKDSFLPKGGKLGSLFLFLLILYSVHYGTCAIPAMGGERAQWEWILECTGEEYGGLTESVCSSNSRFGIEILSYLFTWHKCAIRRSVKFSRSCGFDQLLIVRFNSTNVLHTCHVESTVKRLWK